MTIRYFSFPHMSLKRVCAWNAVHCSPAQCFVEGQIGATQHTFYFKSLRSIQTVVVCRHATHSGFTLQLFWEYRPSDSSLLVKVRHTRVHPANCILQGKAGIGTNNRVCTVCGQRSWLRRARWLMLWQAAREQRVVFWSESLLFLMLGIFLYY